MFLILRLNPHPMPRFLSRMLLNPLSNNLAQKLNRLRIDLHLLGLAPIEISAEQQEFLEGLFGGLVGEGAAVDVALLVRVHGHDGPGLPGYDDGDAVVVAVDVFHFRRRPAGSRVRGYWRHQRRWGSLGLCRGLWWLRLGCVG